jgi:anti-anti-sigma factor
VRCETCILISPEAAGLPPEEIGARLNRCDECPIERGEAPCPAEAIALLARKQREAARSLRMQQNELRKARHELDELRVDMERSERRAATLEELEKANHLAVAAELRAQVELLRRQRDAILALSTPIIQVWAGIVVLPLIGALDDERAAVLTAGLLEGVDSRRARHAIVDLTGVPEMDAATAGHLLKAIKSARLLGADVLLCGLRPQVARAVAEIETGLDLAGLRTLGSLEEALRACGVGRR